MRVEEHVSVPASLDEAWAFVWQTERLAACLPGCVGVEIVEPGKSYRAKFIDHIGPYRVEAMMDVVVEDVEAPERIRIRASGKDSRLGVSQRVALEVRLRPTSPQETALDLSGDVEVLGKVATLGQFAIKRKMNDVIRKFGENIRAQWPPSPSASA
ncbi:MAG TPA: SRPBCC domain-containing protein [Chloroflexota bacterium]|nr:SRPBCC domain-containing protein [Chloroflexota bacterium]